MLQEKLFKTYLLVPSVTFCVVFSDHGTMVHEKQKKIHIFTKLVTLLESQSWQA